MTRSRCRSKSRSNRLKRNKTKRYRQTKNKRRRQTKNKRRRQHGGDEYQYTRDSQTILKTGSVTNSVTNSVLIPGYSEIMDMMKEYEHDESEKLNEGIKQKDVQLIRECSLPSSIESSLPEGTIIVLRKEDKKNLVPSVVHVDGSCRVQIVSNQTNLLFYKLIKKFYDLTKVPILLNTSFNENEPIVRTPEEAIECYLRTKIDVLVMQDWIIKRI